MYTRDEYVQAKLLHARQLHFVSEMYEKRIERLERRVQHLGGNHVRLRTKISKGSTGHKLGPRVRRAFSGHVVAMASGSEQPSDVETGQRQAAQTAMTASTQQLSQASTTVHAAPKKTHLPTSQGMAPIPPGPQSARLRAKVYTPRAAYVQAKEALSAREVSMVSNSGTDSADRLPAIPTTRVVNLFHHSRVL